MRQELTSQVRSIVSELFHQDIDPELTRPDEQFGDYSTNVALRLAKDLDQIPRDIANQIVEKLQGTVGIESVAIAGPGFVNITVTALSASSALQTAWDKAEQSGRAYGEVIEPKNQTVISEFPSPNLAKPYSVGHLRAANQGWAVYKLMLSQGYKVIRDNHLGDAGTPFGKWVVGFQKYSSPEALDKDGIYELARVYIKITKELKAEKERGETELRDEVQSWLQRLEAKDPEAIGYSAQFTTISLDHMHKVLKRLEIETDLELGESFYIEQGQQMVDELLGKGIAELGKDGAVIVKLDDQGIDVPILLRKANGTALYATTDLATLRYRVENYHPAKVFIHVGSEQIFYFQQLFALAKKIGYGDVQWTHVWHGMIDQISEEGIREKMSSRKGVVLLEELLDQAEAKARELTTGRDVSDEDVIRVALGAIKFADFAQDRRTNVLFEWDRIFSLQGYSGPYIQYAGVRVNKILSDGGEDAVSSDGYDWAVEKTVLLKLLDYPLILTQAADAQEPHRVAQFLFELAQSMNRYYETTPILKDDVDEATRAARLSLLHKVSHVFRHGLDCLGIEVPSKM